MDGFVVPSTFSCLGLLIVKGWYYLGMMLAPGKLLEIQFNEPSSDLRCDVNDNRDKDFIRGMCFDQYQKQNNKLGLPLYAFITFNFLAIHVVAVIYSQFVKSTVRELESRHQDAEQRRSCFLFCAYFCHLAISCGLRIISFTCLEREQFYPKTFPANFTCSIKNVSVHCFTQRAGDKNVWIETVKYANGLFALVAFLEILWILLRARKGNWEFYVDHLKSNSGHLELVIAPNDFLSAIQKLKEDCLRGTEQLNDLKQPFRRPNHGEGSIHDLKIDDIYIHVAIHEGRGQHYFAKDRWEQLKEYPPNVKDCNVAKPQDIIDKKHGNVLVVGRPGIGKTSLSTKMLRLWATDEAFHEDHHEKSHFIIVFLVKFRRFNDNANLNLHELLARAETVHHLDDSVLDFVQKEPTKVLLIFDGLDEYSRKEDINAQEDEPTYKNNVEEKMPLSVLYNKLAAGKLLRGANILTTTRPKAVEYVEHVNFQRTVEILGFTSTNVEDYVQKFSQDSTGAKEKIWEHIKSNANLFSLCYIPVNCFLICHCLLQIFQTSPFQQLPTKITDIYQMTVKMVFFKHNRENLSLEELEKLKKTHMYEPFENFPEQLKKIFSRLGKVAFEGIEEERLLFESSEVSGLEECGLLHKLPDVQSKRSLNDPPKSQFCFTHLTVQEFFAAKYLVDTKTNKEIKEFVCKHISDGTWEVVLQFVAGLLKSSSSDIFVKLLPKSTEKIINLMSSGRKELTSWPATEDKRLAVQVCKCLYEINDEQQPVLKNIIEKIKFNAVEFGWCSLAPIDVAAVFHFLDNAEEVLYIDLSANEMGDLGANEVKKFLVNSQRKLKWLNLRGNNLTDKAAGDFAAVLKHINCKLPSLALRSNKFTDNAAKEFAAALRHSNCKLKSGRTTVFNRRGKAK
ncbi:PREDICTED: nucleotide-binding oligomerization domain-containing protein 1-like [Acropora digitifera]|uniref:nucleotide-binding oligomerization domain-containing protein 1-like n=1 Tax=Acropora digitifera TaxID=70779 RepID=UPI00077A6861|nr:PREDICTED: nucleotide-binding oligomerization domain-containing protein 1-like [Acropora digitifera]